MNLNRSNAILAVAALALAVPTWLTMRAELETFVDMTQVPKLFEGFTPDNVVAVALRKPKDPQPVVPPQPGADPNQKQPPQYDQIQFQRTDKGFVLGQAMGEKFGAPVNPQMLELQVWKHLSSIPADRETLVQENATEEQLAEYGLDLAHAFVVMAVNAQQQVLAELLVGKDTSIGAQGAETVRGVYLRKAGSLDVAFYEVPLWNRVIDAQQWLDLAVARIPADMVRRVEVKNQTGQAAFTRKKGEASWVCEAPPAGKGALRQIEVEGLVQRLGHIQAQDYVRAVGGGPLGVYGLEQPKVTVQVVYEKDGKDVTVDIALGNPIDGKATQYVRCSLSDFVCAMPAQWGSGFERGIGEFFDPAATPVDAPKVPQPQSVETGKEAPAPAPAPEQPKQEGSDSDQQSQTAPPIPAQVEAQEKKDGGSATPEQSPVPVESKKPAAEPDSAKDGGMRLFVACPLDLQAVFS